MRKYIRLLLLALALWAEPADAQFGRNAGVVPTATATCPQGTAVADGCSGAQANGTIVDGHLADAQAVIDLGIVSGTGYTNGTCNWSTTGGGGSGANGTITVSGGKLGAPGASGIWGGGFTITSGGSGYTSRPTIVLSGCGSGTGGSVTPTVYQLTPHNCTSVSACNSGIGANWNVAGVDYPIGHDTTLTLTVPSSGSHPANCTFSGQTMTCGSGATSGTVNGYDFTAKRLAIVGGTWTVTNNKYTCNSSYTAALDMVNFAGGSSGTVKYNTFLGGATHPSGGVSPGVQCTGSQGLVAPLQSNQTNGDSLTVQYNYFTKCDAKCGNIGGTVSGTHAITVDERFNYYEDAGICGTNSNSPPGPCDHGEAWYSYAGNANYTVNWTSSFNVAVNHFYLGPTGSTATFAFEADTTKVNLTASYLYALPRGTDIYTGSNNSGQMMQSAVYGGQQGTGGVATGTLSKSIVEYSGAFYPFYSDITRYTLSNNFNAGTGGTCNSTTCN